MAVPTGRGFPPGFEPPAEWETPTRLEAATPSLRRRLKRWYENRWVAGPMDERLHRLKLHVLCSLLGKLAKSPY